MFNDLSKAFGKVHKRVDELKNEKDEELFKIKQYLESVQDTVNSLIINNKYNEEYIEALKFFTWFDWSKLDSQNLIKEVKFKPLEDLPVESIDENIAKIQKIDKLKNVTACFSDQVKTGLTISASATAVYNCPSSFTYANTYVQPNVELVESILDAVKNKKKTEKEKKIPYNECVGGVVDNIYKYDKKIIYRVYKYLLTILNKNKTINEYKSKY